MYVIARPPTLYAYPLCIASYLSRPCALIPSNCLPIPLIPPFQLNTVFRIPPPVYGTDYQGNICGGKGSTQAANKYTTYPRTTEDFVLNVAKKNPLDYTFYGELCASTTALLCVF